MISTNSLPLYLQNLDKFFLGEGEFEVGVDGVKMLARPRSYDLYCLGEVFGAQDYSSTFKLNTVKTVVDLGANIGAFSVWVSQKFKSSKVIAVEMEEKNFQMLIKNIQINGLRNRIKALRAAIYSKNYRVGIKYHFVNVGGHRVDDTQNEAGVEGITLGRLVDKYKLNRIDLLKIDIEGSERFVFTQQNEKLFRDSVKYIIMESHYFDGFDYRYPEKYLSKLGFEVRVRNQWFKRHLMIEALNNNYKG